MYSQNDLNSVNSLLSDPMAQLVILVLMAWSLVWKGIALWKSANNKQRNWFVALLIINSLGILEIIYIFYFSKKKSQETSKMP